MRDKLTIALGLWAALGPIVGILVGHFLTRSWQRRQWILDRRKEEFRELITTLTKSYVTVLGITQKLKLATPDDYRAVLEAETAALVVLRDRMFIAKDVERLRLLFRWGDAVTRLKEDHDSHAFSIEHTKINDDIVKAAVEKPS